ncbi:3322_t:CDS:1, partial [Funneliformis caledonium]
TTKYDLKCPDEKHCKLKRSTSESLLITSNDNGYTDIRCIILWMH